MTAEPASNATCPRSSRTCTWGRLPTIETRSSRPPSARGSARRGPSQEGGSPWLTSPAVPRSRHACRGAPIGLALLIVALARRRGRARHRLAPDQGSRRRSGRRANGLITYAADGDIFTLRSRDRRTTAIVAGPDEDSDRSSRPTARGSRSVAPPRSHGSPADDLVVVGADGSKPGRGHDRARSRGPHEFGWAPRFGAVDSRRRRSCHRPGDSASWWLFDATHRAPRRSWTERRPSYTDPFRPPDGPPS